MPLLARTDARIGDEPRALARFEYAFESQAITERVVVVATSEAQTRSYACLGGTARAEDQDRLSEIDCAFASVRVTRSPASSERAP